MSAARKYQVGMLVRSLNGQAMSWVGCVDIGTVGKVVKVDKHDPTTPIRVQFGGRWPLWLSLPDFEVIE